MFSCVLIRTMFNLVSARIVCRIKYSRKFLSSQMHNFTPRNIILKMRKSTPAAFISEHSLARIVHKTFNFRLRLLFGANYERWRTSSFRHSANSVTNGGITLVSNGEQHLDTTHCHLRGSHPIFVNFPRED
jgi:hypothetical protein